MVTGYYGGTEPVTQEYPRNSSSKLSPSWQSAKIKAPDSSKPYKGGWYFDQEFTKPLTESIQVAEDITLYFRWTDEAATITYHNVGNNPEATYIDNDSYGVGSYFTPSSSSSIIGKPNDDNAFVGWFYDKYLSEQISSGEYIQAESNTDIYLKWSTEKGQITYHDNYEEGKTTPYSYTLGKSQTLRSSALSTRNNYTFEGWYYDAECTRPAPDSIIVEENTDLYAKWSIKIVELTLRLNNGKPSIVIEMEAGSTIDLSKIEEPKLDGYTFAGWYTDSACTKKADTMYAIGGTDKTLYAFFDDTWNAKADTSWYSGSETSFSFSLSSPEELAGLAQLVNEGNSFEGKTIELSSSIDLEGSKWVAIGNITEEATSANDPYSLKDSDFNGFRGIFDGKGNTISNLQIVRSNVTSSYDHRKSYLGLFGIVEDGAVIKNCTIENVSIEGDSMIGAFVGYSPSAPSSGVSGVTLENLHIKGLVEIKASSNAGGIIGRNESSKTKSTLSNLSVEADNGSYIKYNVSAAYHSYLGGIIGAAYSNISNEMDNCKVSGLDITGIYSSVGGLAGRFNKGSIKNSAVSDMTITLEPKSASSYLPQTIGAFVGNATNGNIELNNDSATGITLRRDSSATDALYCNGYIGAESDPAQIVTGLPADYSGITVTTI